MLEKKCFRNLSAPGTIDANELKNSIIETWNRQGREGVEVVHVIEYSAVEQLQAKLEIALKALELCANRKECRNNYECCAKCGPIYEAEEAIEKIEGMR